MSVQDDKAAGQREGQQKPEPNEDAKHRAAEMMKAYEDRPTLVLPGTGGMVSGTAVNEWLDDDGNPKYGNEVPDDAGGDDKAEARRNQVEKDKAWNAELRKAAAENKR